MLTPMIGNVIISEVAALTYVVLSEVEKRVRYGELVGTRECFTLYPRYRTNRGRYNRVRLYILNNYINIVLQILSNLKEIKAFYSASYLNRIHLYLQKEAVRFIMSVHPSFLPYARMHVCTQVYVCVCARALVCIYITVLPISENKYSCISTDRYHVSGMYCG
jgi:hypothetical protein